MTTAKASLRKLARALLGTTCLTVATGTAFATTFTETTDFPSTAPGTVLPVGTTQVNGSINFSTDQRDYFEFVGLLPNSSFSLQATATATGYSDGVSVQNSGGTLLAQPMLLLQVSSSNIINANFTNLTVPSDGDVVVGISQFEGGGPYTVTINANLASAPTPEPFTLSTSLLGLGAAAAEALRRRRSVS